jgi:hypothetical protein
VGLTLHKLKPNAEYGYKSGDSDTAREKDKPFFAGK